MDIKVGDLVSLKKPNAQIKQLEFGKSYKVLGLCGPAGRRVIVETEPRKASSFLASVLKVVDPTDEC